VLPEGGEEEEEGEEDEGHRKTAGARFVFALNHFLSSFALSTTLHAAAHASFSQQLRQVAWQPDPFSLALPGPLSLFSS
jgi:hypothetical protein